MKIKLTVISITMATFLTMLATSLPIFADDDDDDDGPVATVTKAKTPGVTPVAHEAYAKECSACHFAYQAGLLPARSWEKLMADLDDHFGENAELSTAVQTELTQYLTKNAADNSHDKISMKFMRGLSGSETPLRIIEIPYMKREHRKMSKQMVVENPEVKSLSYCNKCHTNAADGSYTEREIKIPGYKNWED